MIDHGWMDASRAYQQTRNEASDIVQRLHLFGNLPCFSVWEDVKETLQSAEKEIIRLRERIRSLEGEDA